MIEPAGMTLSVEAEVRPFVAHAAACCGCARLSIHSTLHYVAIDVDILSKNNVGYTNIFNEN